MFGNKSFLNLLCWGFVAFGLVKAADAQSSKSPTTSKPATQTTVFDLPVRYAVGAKGFAVVGFVNTDAKIDYMWRDVSLPLDTVPNLDEEHRQPLFDPLAAGYRTEIVDPPVEYMRMTNTTSSPGYVDLTSKVFYRWEGNDVLTKDLPKTVVIRDPIADKWRVVIIPKPNRMSAP